MYTLAVERFGERCGVCGSTEALEVDHDHTCCPTNRYCESCIRGLLCGPCNRGVGMFRDRPELLEAAANYLRRALHV
jgi:hypothetical protein